MIQIILKCCCCLVGKSCLTLFRPHGLQTARLPCPWDSPCKRIYRSGLLFPSSGDLPDPGIKATSPALVDRFFTTEPPGTPLLTCQQGSLQYKFGLSHFPTLLSKVNLKQNNRDFCFARFYRVTLLDYRSCYCFMLLGEKFSRIKRTTSSFCLRRMCICHG